MTLLELSKLFCDTSADWKLPKLSLCCNEEFEVACEAEAVGEAPLVSDLIRAFRCVGIASSLMCTRLVLITSQSICIMAM